MYGKDIEGTTTVIGSGRRGGATNDSEESILNTSSKDVYITQTVNIS